MFRHHKPLDEQDSWLKERFRTHTAGAEFMLPWALDKYVLSVQHIKQIFSAAELKTIIESYKNTLLTDAVLDAVHLQAQLTERCAQNDIPARFGSSLENIARLCSTLDDAQIISLIVWAASFWRSQTCSAQAMEKYVNRK
jgi:hypothetical protein